MEIGKPKRRITVSPKSVPVPTPLPKFPDPAPVREPTPPAKVPEKVPAHSTSTSAVSSVPNGSGQA